MRPQTAAPKAAPQAALGLALWALGLAPAAWAQVDPCATGQGNVCVGYSSVTAAVPLSPEAMGLLALLLGGVAFFKLRRRAAGLWGVALSLAVGAGLYLQSGGAGWANGYDRVYTNTGSPLVSPVNNGPLVVVNNLPVNVTITSITINGVAYMPDNSPWPPYEECVVGKVLTPTTGDPTGMCLVKVDS